MGMFSYLSALEVKRDRKQAVGFYLAYTALFFLTIITLSGLLGATGLLGDTYEEAFNKGMVIGQITVVAVIFGFSLLVALKKKLAPFTMVFYVALSTLLGLFGVFLGMIPIAHMTTRD